MEVRSLVRVRSGRVLFLVLFTHPRRASERGRNGSGFGEVGGGWGVIAAAKLHYRRRLVGGRVSTMLAAATLRAEAEERGVAAAGAAGLAEGHPPHLLDAAEMLQAAWDDVSDETIARCFFFPNIVSGFLLLRVVKLEV